VARGRAWTPEEDAAIAEAAALNRRWGRFGPTPAAVHRRAQRIAERSYTSWDG